MTPQEQIDQLKRQNEAMREALLGVFNELSHRHPINTNHLERNDCATCKALVAAHDSLNPTAGSEFVTREEHERLKESHAQELRKIARGGDLILQERDQLRAQLAAMTNSVTCLCQAIDPQSTHGPESEKIAAYGRRTRELASELARSAFSSNSNYRINKAKEMKRHLGSEPEELVNEAQQKRDEDWSLLANQVVGAEMFPPGMEVLKAQLAAATQRAEKAKTKAEALSQYLEGIDGERKAALAAMKQLRADKENAEKCCAEMRAAGSNLLGAVECLSTFYRHSPVWKTRS